MNRFCRSLAILALSLAGASLALPSRADDGERLVRIDHYVGVRSTVPAIAGQMTSIYVREVVRVGTALRDGNNRVVLFIHGAGTPGEVSFDVPYKDYSWMEFLARAGFDVFAMDMTGYGRSTRPAAMNDPCNLSSEQQLELAPAAPGGHAEACAPSYSQQMTTIASDWNDIGAVVDHVLALRHVSQVSLVAWSLGAARGRAAMRPSTRKRCRSSCFWHRPIRATVPVSRRPKCRRPHGAVESPGRLRGPIRTGRVRRAMVRNDRVRFGRSDLGLRRAARAAGHELGMERFGRGRDPDTDLDGDGSPRQAGDARARA
jgi:pimeloyl-ACP methyl ester carboxylesterase